MLHILSSQEVFVTWVVEGKYAIPGFITVLG